MNKRVYAKVPASSSNLGSGFDVLGLSIGLFVEIECWLEPVQKKTGSPAAAAAAGFKLEIDDSSEASVHELPTDHTNFVCVGFAHACSRGNRPLPVDAVVCMKLKSAVPVARGLGSSAASLVAGALAAKELFDLTAVDVCQLCCEIEGEPGNAGPSMLGGLSVGHQLVDNQTRYPPAESGSTTFIVRQFPVAPNLLHRLRVVVFVPETRLETAVARSVLSNQVPRQDVVQAMGRVSMLLTAFADEDSNNLLTDVIRECTQDRLHQPARQQLIPWLPLMIEAVNAADGGVGTYLSGAGPTVAALCVDEAAAQDAAARMADCSTACKIPGTVLNLPICQEGATVKFNVKK